MKIHHDLIGTVHQVECYRNSVLDICARYEESGKNLPNFHAMSLDEVRAYFNDTTNIKMDRVADGVLIELCAQHFYGLKGTDFETIADLIAAIKTREMH